ncbi:MAG: U32 family peptidase [Dissulfurispiraceae bacterium]|jgi:putative protease|nr:U32 family peptidase [Dissulfurispiraceae bacterium]
MNTCADMELLAPAGDFEKLKTAIHYGADAVYLGDSRFSLRGKARNFFPEQLKSAIDFCKEKSVKVYVTLNIIPHNRDIDEVIDHIDLLSEADPDAVIVSDPGIFSIIRKKMPLMKIHVSTQANTTNKASARFWQDMGASRIVLSRELSIDEIKEIRQSVNIELETFVHGSICISYSGRCYISSFLASRGANMGECTNSCRWKYTLMEEKRKGEYLPVFEDDRGTYIMSSRDLCMIEHLDKLADAGVNSLKIEGRMKGINYLAGVVKTYREAVDLLKSCDPYVINPRWMHELSIFSNRGYTTGMYLGKQADADYNFDGVSYTMECELVGVVQEIKNSIARVGLRSRLDAGDEVEYLAHGLEGISFIVNEFSDCDGNFADTARNEDTVFMQVPEGVQPGDLIRRKASRSVL